MHLRNGSFPCSLTETGVDEINNALNGALTYQAEVPTEYIDFVVRKLIFFTYLQTSELYGYLLSLFFFAALRSEF